MPALRLIAALAVMAGLAAGLWLAWARFSIWLRTRERVFQQPAMEDLRRAAITAEQGWLRRWLFLAGYRSPSAPAVFLFSSLACLVMGTAVVWTLVSLGLPDLLAEAVGEVPGGVGEVFLPLAYIGPWFLLFLFAAAPWLAVRQARRKRVEDIERDLPTSLELLSTLSEAGLGFDAALHRVLETRLGQRPLAGELRSFQADLLAGRTRIDALRRLARRMQITSVSIFVSALVQAEQLGMGISAVLRRQADDLRDRRRERANSFAVALPVKRLFPLVICFLPGLFVWTLGPFFVQLFRMADSLVQIRGF